LTQKRKQKRSRLRFLADPLWIQGLKEKQTRFAQTGFSFSCGTSFLSKWVPRLRKHRPEKPLSDYSDDFINPCYEFFSPPKLRSVKNLGAVSVKKEILFDDRREELISFSLLLQNLAEKV
jgi:hypothetical protein